jgi:hypothetical protein
MRKLKKHMAQSNYIKREIIDLCRRRIFDGKEIILFGCTRDAKLVQTGLFEGCYEISAIVDNNPNKKGSFCLGLPVYDPNTYLTPFREHAVIIVCSAFWFEKSKQLESLGYRNGQEYYLVYFRKDTFIREISDSIRTYKNIVLGYRLYQKCLKRFGKEYYVFLCPYPGIGDIYLTGLYFFQYLERENIDKYIFLVNGVLSAKVARLFRIDNIVTVNENQKNCLLAAYQFMGKNCMRFKPLLFWDWRVKRPVNPTLLPVTFEDDIKYDVFKHEEIVKKRYPVFEVREDCIDKIFSANGLIKGKTVILAPYAGAIIGIPKSIWEKIADKLTEKGYCVCTNSKGDDEPPIKRTKAIFFPLGDAVAVMDAAGYFIGMRSGFCDLISSSSCKMIVLYEFGMSQTMLQYFSLRHMGLNEDAIEFEYHGINAEGFIETILEIF